MKRTLAAIASVALFLGCSVVATSASADIFDIDSKSTAIFDIDSQATGIFDID